MLFFVYVERLKAPAELTQLAPAAEAAGIDGIVLAEHLVRPEQPQSVHPHHGAAAYDVWQPDTPYPDVWVTIGALATITTTLRFMTGVYVLPLRDVFHAAKAAGTAAVISDNRLTMGIGVGWMRDEFDVVGSDFRTRGRRMDEMIDVLRLLWRGGMVSYEGEFHSFGPLQMAPAPSEPVPLVIGGSAERALRRAAAVGDGFYPTGIGEEPYRALGRVRELRRKLGRGDEPYDYVLRTRDATPEFHERAVGLGVTTTVVVLPQHELGPALEAIAQLGETARALR